MTEETQEEVKRLFREVSMSLDGADAHVATWVLLELASKSLAKVMVGCDCGLTLEQATKFFEECFEEYVRQESAKNAS